MTRTRIVFFLLCFAIASGCIGQPPAGPQDADTAAAAVAKNGRCAVDSRPSENPVPEPVSISEERPLPSGTDKTWTWKIDNSSFKSFKAHLSVQPDSGPSFPVAGMKWELSGGQCTSVKDGLPPNSVWLYGPTNLLNHVGKGAEDLGNWTIKLSVETSAAAKYKVNVKVVY